ncbi:MAG: AAA family ATPase [Methanomassiliicoccaceae archaeon]|nr:AAA family ATPase [Methanomassiliicoccaceae archaeon]
MHREAMERLIEWKSSERRKPMIIHGLRQTGKTWLAEEFGKNHFDSMVTVNMEDRRFHEAFANTTDPDAVLRILSIITGKCIDASSLVFFDEIQECPGALASLKYFFEKRPDIFIVAAGSLLGVSSAQGRKFPVGKVDGMTLRPMNFREFLTALGNERIADAIKNYDTDIIDSVSADIRELLRTYMSVGGMPEAVLTYVETGDIMDVRKVQEALLHQYQFDMSNHPPKNTIPHMKAVWDSIPDQLSKDAGRKFVYSLMKSKGGAAVYMSPILWLCDYGLLTMVPKISKPGNPLAAYSDRKSFKLFAADIGLICAKSGLDPKAVAEGDRMFTEFRGALTEQFALQELIAAGHRLYYWTAENSDGEIDLITESDGRAIPIEVKAGENLKAKSLSSFRERYDVHTSVRTSLSGSRDEGWMVNIPLCAIGSLDTALAKRE